MHPLVKAAPFVALIAALSAASSLRAPKAPAPSAPPSADNAARSASPLRPCAANGVALGSAAPCVMLPTAGEAERSARERLLAREPTAKELRLDSAQDRVPRLADRPEAWDAYLLPVEALGVTSTADHDPTQADRATTRVRLATARGAAVQLIELEGQRGTADVVAVGPSPTLTVVTRHRIGEGTSAREVLVVHAGLERLGPSVHVGAPLGPMAVVGFIDGASNALEYEVRELRSPLETPPAHLADLESPALAFAVDPRNVLPLRK